MTRSIWIISLLLVATIYSLSGPTIHIASTLPVELDQFIETQQSLPRYEESGYYPLGRSPVVDALLGDPFYLPVYAESVSNQLKQISETNSFYAVTTATLIAGGIPIPLDNHFTLLESEETPSPFIEAFGHFAGQKIHFYWLTFMHIYNEAKTILSALSEEEKEWLRENYEAFFFGKMDDPNEYDFFTTESEMPLKFFEMASRIDLAELSDCARKLTLIVDDVYQNWETFAGLYLKEDFVWNENGLKLLISSKDHVTHRESTDFFIDLGGSNTILTNAGGTEGRRAAALHIDLWGDNTYEGKEFVQGSGFLGIGILASFSGNNRYKASQYSQGCGFLGTGLLMNMGKQNQFELDFGGQSCALFGSSVVWNKAGFNTYLANQGMAQAASSTLGVAFLIDSEGNDSYVCGVFGKGGSRSGGIGQGGSTGVRHYPVVGYPSFYGGLSFLYNGGGNNNFKTAWLGQGSAYFLGAGILVVEESHNNFLADYDAQGQGLHLSAGLLMLKGGYDYLKGGWGSIGVAGDRSIGMLINTGGYSTYEGTDQSVGTARKPKAIGVMIDTKGHNNYLFQKSSNANIQLPASPSEWPAAFFLTLGGYNTYPVNVDEMKRGTNLQWGIKGHSKGIDQLTKNENLEEALFAKFPKQPKAPFRFDPIQGWPTNVAFRPLKTHVSTEDFITSDYELRRHLYESIDLKRFSKQPDEVDSEALLSNIAEMPDDLFNYLVLRAIADKNEKLLPKVLQALDNKRITSDYARKMAITYVAKFGKENTLNQLAEVMLTDLSEENQAAAAGGFAKSVTEPFLPILQQGLNHSSETVRYRLLTSLQDRHIAGLLPLIKPFFQDPSLYVRRAAALTAISLCDKEGIPILLDSLQFETLDTTDNYGDNLYNALAKYTGVNFGLDRAAWVRWWNQVQDTFEFSVCEKNES